MLCEKCQKNEANVHISKNINGQETELHLCESCAKDSGELMSMNQFLGSFLESVMPLRVRRAAYMPSGKPADNQYAGCEDCVEDLPAFKSACAVPPAVNPEGTKLTELKKKMKEAVVNEEFERAAELRDEIKQLEEEQEDQE